MAEKPRRRKRPLESERYTSAEFRPYVTAIGQIALAWNDLHETLCALFVSLTSSDDSMVESAWQSLPSDRAKRGMLRAAIGQLSHEMKRRNPRAEEEMKWLFGQLDRLEEDRNNAIHAPLATFSSPVWKLAAETFNQPQTRFPGVQPDDVRWNRRAANLRNKHLLTEYRYVRDAVITFRDYAEEIQLAWNWVDDDEDTWPDRPTLPNRGLNSRTKSQQKKPLQ